MAEFSIKITNLKQLQTAFMQSPQIVGQELSKGINAVLANIQKLAKDGGDSGIFQFKTPRFLRTGYLNQSFAYGINKATPENLVGSIGPTALYAKFVEFGTSRGIQPNSFMERLRDASQEEAQNQIIKSINSALEKIAKKTFL